MLILFYFMLIHVLVKTTYVCLCIMCVPTSGTWRPEEGIKTPALELRQLWAAMCVLKTELRSSGRKDSVNHQAISPTTNQNTKLSHFKNQSFLSLHTNLSFYSLPTFPCTPPTIHASESIGEPPKSDTSVWGMTKALSCVSRLSKASL